MKIIELNLSGVGGIYNLPISFGARMNIICGPNGIGKSTILEAIVHSIGNSWGSKLKKHVLVDKGVIEYKVDVKGDKYSGVLHLNTHLPIETTHYNGFVQGTLKVMYFRTTRVFDYASLNSISRDPERKSNEHQAVNGVLYGDMKNWLANRYLFSATQGAFSSQKLQNLELAKKCFSLLNDTHSFSRVDASTFDIFVNTPNGEIWYEYLSSGFKSCITLLLSIIKEIEYRFPDDCVAEDFEGIVLIDELELHLHPEWQGKIVSVLKLTFPNIQFIITTHSPHIVQNSEPDQIKALAADNNGLTYIRDLPDSKYGYSGWTLDEVLTDVMGMSDTRTIKFQSLVDLFNEALDIGDADKVRQYYLELDKALHPNNIARKMFYIQMRSVCGDYTDD